MALKKPAAKSAAQQSASDKPKGKPPVFTVQFGKCKVTVWENDGKYGEMYALTVSKVYQVDGEWRESHSIDEGEMLDLAEAIELAYRTIKEGKGQGIRWPDSDKSSSEPSSVPASSESGDISY